jgi:tetratricopeptide (TPR) repeat protein
VSHPFGDLLRQHLSRRHGLSQNKLAAGIDQSPSVISAMCHGRRLTGPQARGRVLAIIRWFHRQGVLTFVEEANALLKAAGMADLDEDNPEEAELLESLTVKRNAVPTSAFLHQLPSPPRDFIGRGVELGELVASHNNEGTTIFGLWGMGGVGKTSLALVLAEQLTLHYPDAQFYLDLKGTSEHPLSPADVMAYIIRSHNREAKLPESLDELKALYQSILHGKHALLVMDNAASAQQVAPLIPAEKNCVMLVTSRTHFTLPGMVAKNLHTMPPDESRALLLRITPRIGDKADTIAELCGYLPLALRLVGSTLAVHIDFSVEDFMHRLTNARQRLELIDSSRSLTHEPSGVEASLSLSYELLNVEMQRLGYALAVFPDTFDVSAAAAVWQMESDRAQTAISELVVHSLVEWDSSNARYRLHDLVRLFTDAHLSKAEQATSQFRHAKHYLNVVSETKELYEQGGEALKRGLDMFDLEWVNIQTGQVWAATHASENDAAAQLCSAYPDFGKNLLKLRQHPQERIRWREAGLIAARRLKKLDAVARHLNELGLAYYELGESRRAIEFYEQALGIYREIGDRQGEGSTLGNLGLTYVALSEQRRAIESFEQHLAIANEVGDRRGEANALGNLGIAYKNLGEPHRSIELYEQALGIDREIGNRYGEGATLIDLGNAYYELDDPHRAIEFYEQALAINREIGDRRNEGNTLGNLGLAYAALGELHQAIEFYEKALVIDRAMGDRLGEGITLSNLGEVYMDLGATSRAIELYEEALSIAHEISDKLGEGDALWNMSLVLDKLGDRAQAIAHAEVALRIFEQIENPNAEKVRKKLAEWRGQK